MLPLVTVITPAYNCAKFIEQTIQSVLSQQANIEYIVIDDCSTDGTADIISKYEKDILFIRHEKNEGEQKSVNEGLAWVVGKYFMIVNADDPLLPSAVNTLLAFMETHPDILCAYPDWNSIGEDGSFRSHVQSREYDFAYMVKHHTCLPSVGSMFRRSVKEIVGYRDTSYRWLGDFDYWLRIGLAGEMARVPATLATWRNRNGQASRNKSDLRAREHIRIIREFYKSLEPNLVSVMVVSTIGFTLEEALSKSEIYKGESEARCWAYLVAASVTDTKRKMWHYLTQAILIYPQLLLKPEFYSVAFKRLKYFLRR